MNPEIKSALLQIREMSLAITEIQMQIGTLQSAKSKIQNTLLRLNELEGSQ
jgi:hypothetical protein